MFIQTLQLHQVWSCMANWCVTCLGANEKYLRNITFSVFPYISSLFWTFLFTVMSVVLSYHDPCHQLHSMCNSFRVISINVAIKFPSIESVHSDITVASGLKLHGYLMCHMPRCKWKIPKKLHFFCFSLYSFTFLKFSLYSYVSGIELPWSMPLTPL